MGLGSDCANTHSYIYKMLKYHRTLPSLIWSIRRAGFAGELTGQTDRWKRTDRRTEIITHCGPHTVSHISICSVKPFTAWATSAGHLLALRWTSRGRWLACVWSARHCLLRGWSQVNMTLWAPAISTSLAVTLWRLAFMMAAWKRSGRNGETAT